MVLVAASVTVQLNTNRTELCHFKAVALCQRSFGLKAPATLSLSPAQQQLGVVLALQVAVDEVGQQVLEHVGGVLQAALQRRHDERGHVAAVAHGEGALHLQRADEGEQEHLVVDELAELLQGLLHVQLAVARHLCSGNRQDMGEGGNDVEASK